MKDGQLSQDSGSISKPTSWTEIATKEEQLQAILEHGFQGKDDIELIQEAVALVLAEIGGRKAGKERKLVVGAEYQIAYFDEDPSRAFDGTATFQGLDDEDYGTGESHGHFCIIEGKEVVSFPLKSVGRRCD